MRGELDWAINMWQRVLVCHFLTIEGLLQFREKDGRPKQQIVAAYEEDLFGDHAGMLEI